MQIRNLFYCALVIIFSGCIELFNPQLNDYLEIPVVDGGITNEPGPYTVKLSKSSSVYNPEFDPISGAIVIISDDLNFEEALVEVKPGVYSTDAAGIRGEVGRKYRVTVEMDGKIYQSSFEELLEPVGIDSVYAKTEYKGNQEGMQFYLNTETLKDDNRQFLWTLIETYKYEADEYPVDFIYIKPDSIFIPPYEYVEMIRMCWKTDKVFQIFTGSAKNISQPGLSNIPLHYVDTKTKKLSQKYSLFVSQYSISDAAYQYWNEIKEQNEKSGSLYTRQPFQIAGNISSIDNADDIIFGYFTVAGVSNKRIFVEKPSLFFYYDECKATHDTYLAWLAQRQPPYPAYIKYVEDGMGKASLPCFDCRSEGGTTNKPDFWED